MKSAETNMSFEHFTQGPAFGVISHVGGQILQGVSQISGQHVGIQHGLQGLQHGSGGGQQLSANRPTIFPRAKTKPGTKNFDDLLNIGTLPFWLQVSNKFLIS